MPINKNVSILRSKKQSYNFNPLDFIGKQFGNLTVREYIGEKDVASKRVNGLRIRYIHTYLCSCSSCGGTVEAARQSLAAGHYTSCGCAKYSHGNKSRGWKGVGSMGKRIWTTTRLSAKRRSIPFSLHMADMWSLYVKQDGKCALSGFPLSLGNVDGKITASIDRINNSEGYTIENIQWVHVDINAMKLDKSDAVFIAMCAEVCHKHALIAQALLAQDKQHVH